MAIFGKIFKWIAVIILVLVAFLRIAQILFAGLFAVASRIIVEHLLRPGKRRLRMALSKLRVF